MDPMRSVLRNVKNVLSGRWRHDGVGALVAAAGRVSTEPPDAGTGPTPPHADPSVLGFWLRRSQSVGREAFLLRTDGWSQWRFGRDLIGAGGDDAHESLDRFLHGSWSPFFGSEGGDAVVRAGGAVLFPQRRSKTGAPFSKALPAPARAVDSFSRALLSASRTEDFQEAAAKGEPLLLERPGDRSSAHETLEREMFLDRVDPERILLKSLEEMTRKWVCAARLWSFGGCVVTTGYAPGWFDGGMELIPAATACAALD